MGPGRAIQQRISGVEMPHFVTHFLACFVRDSSIPLRRRTCQLAKINLVFDRVEVDSDEIKIRGKVFSHLHQTSKFAGPKCGASSSSDISVSRSVQSFLKAALFPSGETIEKL